MIGLLYIMKKLFDELDEEFNEPKVSEAQRKLWEARDMARWKAWKAKQQQENDPRKKEIEQAKKRAEEELNEYYKLPYEIQEKYTPIYDPRALKYVYIINESVERLLTVDDIIKAETQENKKC